MALSETAPRIHRSMVRARGFPTRLCNPVLAVSGLSLFLDLAWSSQGLVTQCSFSEVH